MGIACSVSSDGNHIQPNLKASYLNRSNPFALVNQSDHKVDIYTAYARPAQSFMRNPFETVMLKQNDNGDLKLTTSPQAEIRPIRCAPKLHETNVNWTLNNKFHDSSKVCDICIETSSQDKFGTLEGCGHAFHTQCMRSYINWARVYRKMPIKCPDTTCDKYLTFEDVECFLSGQDLVSYYEVWAELNKKDVIHCKTPGCNRAIILNGDNHIYCLGCFAHINLSGSSDKEFVSFVTANNFRQCSQCKYWVEKSLGCIHMTCRCRYQFCYVCGSKWRTCTCSSYS